MQLKRNYPTDTFMGMVMDAAAEVVRDRVMKDRVTMDHAMIMKARASRAMAADAVVRTCSGP